MSALVFHKKFTLWHPDCCSCRACTICIYTIAALVWMAGWSESLFLMPGVFSRGPWMPTLWSSLQIYPLHICMCESGQTWVPCIGIPVTQEVWEYATVKQRSTIQLPKIALSQKRQCCFCRSVLNQPKYYFRARAIIHKNLIQSWKAIESIRKYHWKLRPTDTAIICLLN